MINEEYKEEKVDRAVEGNQEGVKPEAPQTSTVPSVKPVLHIQYGSFHMELPGEIDIDSVAGILREIQKTLV